MTKKEMILRVHKYAISQGTGTDTRWYTRIDKETKGGAKKKVARSTEEELYDYLYQYYYGNTKPAGRMTLEELYPEWFRVKSAMAVRSSTLHRLDTDYRRFYTVLQ